MPGGYVLRVRLPADRDRSGTIELVDARGRVRFAAAPVAGRASDLAAQRGGNPTRDRTRPYGDTPLGIFRIARVVTEGVDEDLYGTAGVIVLEPTAGEAALAEALGRFRLFVHGGPTRRGALVATSGALRMRDRDLAKLCTLLKAEDVRECHVEEGPPGPVRVVQGGSVLDDPPVRIAPPTSQHERRHFMRTGARFAAGAAGALLITKTRFVWAQDGGGSTGYEGGTNDSGEQVYFEPEPQAVYYDDQGSGITDEQPSPSYEPTESLEQLHDEASRGFDGAEANPEIVTPPSTGDVVFSAAAKVYDYVVPSAQAADDPERTGEPMPAAPQVDASATLTPVQQQFRDQFGDEAFQKAKADVDAYNKLDQVQKVYADQWGIDELRKAQADINRENEKPTANPPSPIPTWAVAPPAAPPPPANDEGTGAEAPSTSAPNVREWDKPHEIGQRFTTEDDRTWVVNDKGKPERVFSPEEKVMIGNPSDPIHFDKPDFYLNSVSTLQRLEESKVVQGAEKVGGVIVDVWNAGINRIGTMFSKKKPKTDDGGDP